MPKASKWGYQTKQNGVNSIGRESIGSKQGNACLQHPQTVAVAIQPRNSDWSQFLASNVPETCLGPALCNVGLHYTIHTGHPAPNVGVLLMFCNPSPVLAIPGAGRRADVVTQQQWSYEIQFSWYECVFPSPGVELSYLACLNTLYNRLLQRECANAKSQRHGDGTKDWASSPTRVKTEVTERSSRYDVAACQRNYTDTLKHILMGLGRH